MSDDGTTASQRSPHAERIILEEARVALDRQWKTVETYRTRATAALATIVVVAGFLVSASRTADPPLVCRCKADGFLIAYAVFALLLVAVITPSWKWHWNATPDEMRERFDSIAVATRSLNKREPTEAEILHTGAHFYDALYSKNEKKAEWVRRILVFAIEGVVLVTLVWLTIAWSNL